jgi:anti-sigma28 factor (negative regulator of flagellin synthesis)
MVGMEGIQAGAVGAGAAPRTSSSHKDGPATPSQPRDDVQISPEAKSASVVSKLTEEAKQRQAEIRAERVEEAKKHIEEGTYRMQNVVRIVAARMTSVIPE